MAMAPLKPPAGPMARDDTGEPHVAWAGFHQDVANRLVSIDTTQSARSLAIETAATALTASVADIKANEGVVATYLYRANGTPPPKYLAANGAAVSRTTYANLFAVIGTTYGAGNGTTTFNLPTPPVIASTFIFIRFAA